MDSPNLDVGLLNLTYKAILDSEGMWDQTMWRRDWDQWKKSRYRDLERTRDKRCGTTYCFAGFVVELTKHETGVKWDRSTEGDGDTHGVTLDGCSMTAETYAREELGLNDTEAAKLFSAVGVSTTLELQEVVEDIKDGKYR